MKKYGFYARSIKVIFLSLKVIHHQNWYLCWGFFNIWEYKIDMYIYHAKKIAKFLENFPLFGTSQGLGGSDLI